MKVAVKKNIERSILNVIILTTMLFVSFQNLYAQCTAGIKNAGFEETGNVIAYPVPACYPISDDYVIRVNGTNVPVIKHEYYPYVGATSKVLNVLHASFYFKGTAVIEIEKQSASINSFTISPKKYNIAPIEPDSKTLKFAINEPKHLYININDTEILLFAENILTNQPASSGVGIYNITNYGAGSNNNSTVNQKSKIQAAIDAASSYGTPSAPGTVYVPAGVYYTTDLKLKDNVNLYLEGGSVLRGTGNSDNYGSGTSTKTVLRLDGSSSNRIENVKIYGPGFIDANGVSTAEAPNVPDFDDKINDRTGHKMRCIDADYIRNITVEDVLVREGTSWQVSFHEGNDLSVERVKVISHRIMKHNDGIDVSACQDVVIRNCFALGFDDNFCIKDDPYQPSQNILIENILGYSHSRTFKIGMQAYNAARNCTIKNVDVIRSRQACHLQQIRGGNAIWEDILIENFTIDYNLQASDPFDIREPAPFCIELEMDGGIARNITVKNFTYLGDNWSNSGFDSDMDQFSGVNTVIDSISFVNFKVGGSYAISPELANMDTNRATNVTFKIDLNNQAPEYKNVPIPASSTTDTCTDSVTDPGTNLILDELNESLRAYPNPFNNQVIVEFNRKIHSNVQIYLLDVMGKAFFYERYKPQISVNDEFKINTSQLSGGLYFLIVMDESEKNIIKTIRLIKNNSRDTAEKL